MPGPHQLHLHKINTLTAALGKTDTQKIIDNLIDKDVDVIHTTGYLQTEESINQDLEAKLYTPINGNKIDYVIQDESKNIDSDEITNDDIVNFIDFNFEDFIRNQERIGLKLKFNEEVKKEFKFEKNLKALRTPNSEKGYFLYQNNIVYTYTANSRNPIQIWSKFIKDFWYSDKQKDLRIKIYLDIHNRLQAEENDLDSIK